jgi:hypothetical protein
VYGIDELGLHLGVGLGLPRPSSLITLLSLLSWISLGFNLSSIHCIFLRNEYIPFFYAVVHVIVYVQAREETGLETGTAQRGRAIARSGLKNCMMVPMALLSTML